MNFLFPFYTLESLREFAKKASGPFSCRYMAGSYLEVDPSKNTMDWKNNEVYNWSIWRYNTMVSKVSNG